MTVKQNEEAIAALQQEISSMKANVNAIGGAVDLTQVEKNFENIQFTLGQLTAQVNSLNNVITAMGYNPSNY